jgi:hypothetical protein
VLPDSLRRRDICSANLADGCLEVCFTLDHDRAGQVG